MKENRELKKHKDEKLRVLLLTIIAYFVFFVIKKMDIITEYLGIVMLILLYMYANYNLINIFFTSKRTTFKIYAFLLLEVIYLFTGNISMIGTITYIILFLLLIFSVRKDEGRSEIPKITKFVQIFLIFKVVFVLSMLVF
ncbi:phospholipid phosphatase [Leptotrichia hongkongensis]|uniref:Phospholipid phosphatase n=1 Tax=Leptotrichia hongkongensis TaxID=554406 RepID=A0ABV4S878_9FUSO|nr:phospholipid phosphatase [Leptotrichia hongkongensis]